MSDRIIVPAATARAVTLRAGQRLRIVNVEGKQVADFVAFNAADLDESLSTLHTLVSLKRLFPTAGDQLRTNRRRPMVEITRDDTGRHDMLIAACDPWRYEMADGRVEFGESLARPGDVVELRALIDLVAAVSACPMDLNPISGYRVTDLALEIA